MTWGSSSFGPTVPVRFLLSIALDSPLGQLANANAGLPLKIRQ
jgi:hypothetical protein